MPIKSLPIPSQDRLKSLFSYDKDSGALTWRHRPESDFISVGAYKAWNAQHANTLAGGTMGIGYCRVSVDGRRYLSHRIIWTLVFGGKIPRGRQVDHINGNRADNRISNLRIVTVSENRRNQKTNSANTSGVTGVTWHRAAKKWATQAGVNGRAYRLGLYENIEDAANVIAEFYRKNGFTERHIGGPS